MLLPQPLLNLGLLLVERFHLLVLRSVVGDGRLVEAKGVELQGQIIRMDKEIALTDSQEIFGIACISDPKSQLDVGNPSLQIDVPCIGLA